MDLGERKAPPAPRHRRKRFARSFLRARAVTVAELLSTLAAIGQAREMVPGTFVV